MKLHRRLLRRLVPPAWLNRINHLAHLEDRLYDLEARCARLAGLALSQRAPELFARRQGPEFEIFSQNGEDGILLWLLEQTGAAVKTFAEIGVGDGRESNTAILGFVLGWDGRMWEADALGAAAARRLAERMSKDRPNGVKVYHQLVTRENIDALLGEGELGVLSIDVDGMDYWLWSAVRSARPRIVIIEYNASLGWEQSLTIPYQPRFAPREAHPSGYYHGASLPALEKLGRQKGYDLVSVCSAGVNAFFVREDIRPPSLPVRSTAELFRPHEVRGRVHSPQQQWDLIRHLPYVQV